MREIPQMVHEIQNIWKKLCGVLLLSMSLSIIAMTGVAEAGETYTWDGGNVGDWQDEANWTALNVNCYPGHDLDGIAVFNTDNAVVTVTNAEPDLYPIAALNVSADTLLNLSADLEVHALNLAEGKALTVITADSVPSPNLQIKREGKDSDTSFSAFTLIANSLDILADSTLDISGTGAFVLYSALKSELEFEPIAINIANTGKFIFACPTVLSAVIDNHGKLTLGGQSGGTLRVNAFENSVVDFVAQDCVTNLEHFELNLAEPYSILQLQDDCSLALGTIFGNENTLNVTGSGRLEPYTAVSVDINLGTGTDTPSFSTGGNCLEDVSVTVNSNATLFVVNKEPSADVIVTSDAKLSERNSVFLRNLTFSSQDAVLAFSYSDDEPAELTSQDVGLVVNGVLSADKGFTLCTKTFRISGDLPVVLISADSMNLDHVNVLCSPDFTSDFKLFVRDNMLYLAQTAAHLDVTDDEGNQITPEEIQVGDKVVKEVVLTSPQGLTFASSTWYDEEGTAVTTESPTLFINGEATDINPNNGYSEDSDSSFTIPATEMRANNELYVTIRATVSDTSAENPESNLARTGAAISAPLNDGDTNNNASVPGDTVESEPICVLIGKGVLNGYMTATSSDISVNESVDFTVLWTNKFAEVPAESPNLNVAWTIDDDPTVLSTNANTFTWTFTQDGTHTVKASAMLNNDSDLSQEVHLAVYVAKLPKFDSAEGCNAGMNLAGLAVIALFVSKNRRKS